MAESAISFLLNELSVLLKEEQKLLGGLGQEVEFIRAELDQMRAFLRVADSKEETDPQLKEWVKQLRQIGYAIEDALDKYILQFARHDGRGIKNCMKKSFVSMKNLKARHQIASVGIEHLSDLEYLGFTDMTEEFVERVLNEKREQGEHWNLAHIPQLYVADNVNGGIQFWLPEMIWVQS